MGRQQGARKEHIVIGLGLRPQFWWRACASWAAPIAFEGRQKCPRGVTHGPGGTMDAVKVHRPRESASRGDDFDVRHRNTFCTFCRFHTDRARFDQVWVPATGLSSGLGRGDTIAATGLGAWPRRNLNPVGLLLAHRRNPARTTLYPLPLKAVRFVQYRTHTECRGLARWQYRCIGQRGEVQRMKGPLLDTSISRGRSVGRQAAKFEPRA